MKRRQRKKLIEKLVGKCYIYDSSTGKRVYTGRNKYYLNRQDIKKWKLKLLMSEDNILKIFKKSCKVYEEKLRKYNIITK